MKLLLIIVAFCSMASCQRPQAAHNPPPKAAQPDTIFVLGEVRTPQNLPYTPELTLSAAIGNSGGLSDFGDTPIYLIRDGSVILKTTARRVFRNLPPDDSPLKPKDTVYAGRITNLK